MDLETDYKGFLFSHKISSPGVSDFSDKRIKNDIKTINDSTALDKVNQLESKEYNYIDPIKKINENNRIYCTRS